MKLPFNSSSAKVHDLGELRGLPHLSKLREAQNFHGQAATRVADLKKQMKGIDPQSSEGRRLAGELSHWEIRQRHFHNEIKAMKETYPTEIRDQKASAKLPPQSRPVVPATPINLPYNMTALPERLPGGDPVHTLPPTLPKHSLDGLSRTALPTPGAVAPNSNGRRLPTSPLGQMDSLFGDGPSQIGDVNALSFRAPMDSLFGNGPSNIADFNALSFQNDSGTSNIAGAPHHASESAPSLTPGTPRPAPTLSHLISEEAVTGSNSPLAPPPNIGDRFQ
jgi:hypothetical protein